jgi:hypothetical protein
MYFCPMIFSSSACLRVFSCLLVGFAAAQDEGALQSVAAQPTQRIELAKSELKRVAGEKLETLAKDPRGVKFLAQILGRDEWLQELMFSGPLPDDPAKMLDVLHELWKADPQGIADAHERSTATAVALTFGASKWPSEHAFARYAYFRDSRKNRQLHPQFDQLATWEKRFVVSAGSNGNHGGWDDASLVWLRDNVKLRAKEYIGACWQAPYHSLNLFGDSVHNPKYYAPFSEMIHAHRVREVGGVCGSLSHYGATAARANGIPAITMGEPGHCAYAVRVARGEWVPAYSISWQRGLHTSLWGRTWTQLILQEKVLGDRTAHEKSMAHLWQARALRDAQPELAESAYRLALEAQPLHQPAWIEATAFLHEVRKPAPASWIAIQNAALTALGDFPEAAWEVISPFQEAALASLGSNERLAYLLKFHETIATREGPVMWRFDQALESQTNALSAEPGSQMKLFEKVLAIQAGSKNLFAPTIAWGQSKYGNNPGTADAFFAMLSRVFSSKAAGENQDGLRSAMRPAVLAAAEHDNVEAFQALGKAGTSLRDDKPLDTEPFTGELLSSGGLLKISTTSRWDRPENHWGVLESCGGAFHTNKEVRPHAIVRLGKLGDLSGIVIHDHSGGGTASRQLPLQVSISEDGSEWTAVYRSDKHQRIYRIPLDGKATRVQFIKVGRDDDRDEVFHLNAIHAYGRRLQ